MSAAIAGEYPSLAGEPGQELHLFVSLQAPFVQNCKNADLFLLGRFDSPLRFTTLDNETAECFSLAASLEIKSHAAPGVCLEGDQVWVQYDDGASSATLQAYNQPFAVKALLERKGFNRADLPFISECVWLNQCRAEQFSCELERLPLDVPFAGTTFAELLAKVLARREGATNLRTLKRDFDFAGAASRA